MAEKKTHFGRAGEFFAMSELLVRGWNVAVPVVDVGEDAFLIDDRDKTTLRLQVKTGDPIQEGADRYKVQFSIARSQLQSLQSNELIYVLLARIEARWRFLVLEREELLRVRIEFENRERTGPGRPASKHAEELTLPVVLQGNQANFWGTTRELERWPERLPVVRGGPGTTGG